MKMSKKIVALTAIAAMVVTAVPVIQSTTSEVKAAAFEALAKYDFESGTGMSGGVGGTAPSVTNDDERGSVLQFADGSGSKLVSVGDPVPGQKEHSWKIDVGSPSSLRFSNPFKGKNLSGVTIAMWVKVPTEKAAGITGSGDVDETLAVASGLVGFVDDKERELVHPDCEDGGHSDQVYSGRTHFGISAQPCVYFTQIHSNSFASVDTDATMSEYVGQWKYLAVSVTNDGAVCYIDGKKVKGSEVNVGKRFKTSEEYSNPGNEGMPYLLDFLADDMSYRFGGKKGTYTFVDKNSKKEVTYGKIESNVQCYVGFTGFSGTQAGVRIDDLVLFDKAYKDGEMASLFEAAKTPDGIGVKAGGSNVSDITGGGTGSSSSSAGSSISVEAAAAIAASTRLVNAPEGVTIGTPVSILKNDPALAETFNTLKTALDNTVPALVAANPEWNGLRMSNNIYIMDVPLTGRELVEGETATVEMNVPEGFDTNMLWVLRINDDGSVTKCDITAVADGKLQFVTDKLCKFAVVEMTFGKSLPKTGVVSTGIFVLIGASAVTGGTCMLKRKKED